MTETGYCRYGMHDLLRRYGRYHAAAGPDHDQALGLLLDYYQYTAATAQGPPGPPEPPRPAAPRAPPVVPVLEDAGQALGWARAERDGLLACLDHVTRPGTAAATVPEGLFCGAVPARAGDGYDLSACPRTAGPTGGWADPHP